MSSLKIFELCLNTHKSKKFRNKGNNISATGGMFSINQKGIVSLNMYFVEREEINFAALI